MMKRLQSIRWMLFLFVVMMITGCGEEPQPEPIILVDSTPAQIVNEVNNERLTWQIYFDKPPQILSISGAVEHNVSGTILFIKGSTCSNSIKVVWKGGEQTFRCSSNQRREEAEEAEAEAAAERAGPPDASQVTVEPPPGHILKRDQAFELTFDQGVDFASVNGAGCDGSGLNWRVKLILNAGANQHLEIAWTNRDGSAGWQRVGPYTVIE